jgi:Zn-finger protein
MGRSTGNGREEFASLHSIENEILKAAFEEDTCTWCQWIHRKQPAEKVLKDTDWELYGMDLRR